MGLIAVYPAAIAFYLLSCAVPFLLLLFWSLGHIFPSDAALPTLSRYIQDWLPPAGPARQGALFGPEMFASMILAVREKRQVFGLMGWGILVVAAASLMNTLRLTLNAVLGARSPRSRLQAQLRDLLVFGFVGGAVLLAVTLLWSLSTFGPAALARLGPDAQFLHPAFMTGLAVVCLAFNVPLLYGLYRFLPDQRPSPRAAFAAALSFAALWELARRLLGWYLARTAARYSLVYGASAAFMLAGIWLYYCAVLFTLCAALGAAYDRSFREEAANP